MPVFVKKSKNDNVLIQNTNLQKTILQYFGFAEFNHELNYVSWVSDTNANLFNPKDLNLKITNQDELVNKIKAYLNNTDFSSKNWISEKICSEAGVVGYLIFSYNNKLQFQTVRVSNRSYNVVEELISCTIFYDDYFFNNQQCRLFETYTLLNEKVQIVRSIYTIKEGILSKEPANFNDYNINNLLDETQELNINYLPISIKQNLPTERSDCLYALGKIKALDIAFEQIILDMLLNSSKFLINENGMIGNVKKTVNDTLLKFIKNNVLVLSYDPDENATPFNVVNGTFRGKSLTDIYDWIVTEINKRIGIYVPAEKKGAQQSVPETSNLNIQTSTMIEQKTKLREKALANFVKLLMKFDNDVLGGQSFKITNASDLQIEVTLQINQAVKNQVEGVTKNVEVSTKATKSE